MSVSDIRVAGRATQGVKLINLRGTDSIAAVSVVAKSEEEGEAGPATGPETTNPAVEE
jgi:DNA gyrase subunit A